MDMLLLLKVNGFACELQLNIDELLKVKESGPGHGMYEKERKWNDELIYACMTGDSENLQLAITEGGNPLKPRDMYGLGPLHYAVQHGDLHLIEMLFADREEDAFQFLTAQDARAGFPFFEHCSSDITGQWSI